MEISCIQGKPLEKKKAPKVMLQRSKINTTNVPREMEISLRGECSYST